MSEQTERLVDRLAAEQNPAIRDWMEQCGQPTEPLTLGERLWLDDASSQRDLEELAYADQLRRDLSGLSADETLRLHCWLLRDMVRRSGDWGAHRRLTKVLESLTPLWHS